MGRRYLWRGSGIAILLSQTCGEPERARSRVSFRDDSEPAHCLQPATKSQTRSTPTENHSSRHAECEDAAGNWLGQFNITMQELDQTIPERLELLDAYLSEHVPKAKPL